MNYYLAEFIHEFDKDDTLLIVYYAGHGWALPGGRGELVLAGLAFSASTSALGHALTLLPDASTSVTRRKSNSASALIG